MMNAAICARDCASKSLIPLFGFYYGPAAFFACCVALRLNGFRGHPLRWPAAIGGVLGVFGFCASAVWWIGE